MSVAKNEEVYTHQLGLRLGEPVADVPIKKRPFLLSDKSVPSAMPLSMKPSSNSTGMSASAAGAGCSNEPFLNRSKSDIPNRSFTSSATEKQGLNGSSEVPSCGGSVAPIAKSQSQKFLTLDLQLASRQSAKFNSISPVKKEKVDQGFSIFPSAIPSKDVQTTSTMESPSNSSLGKLSNLDLNVSLHPVDQLEVVPTMHTGHNVLHHTTFQHQKAQVPLVASLSTTSSRLSMNIGSTLNLSNEYECSNNSGAADVTLDLQLKPPTRPELGISWKGLAPDPELSLSLSGHTPKGLNVRDAIFTSEPVGMTKIVSEEVATPGEKILKPVPCNANSDTAMPSTVSGNMQILSSSLVKKEPEEPPRKHIQNNIKKAPLCDQQSVGHVSNCAEFEKTGNTYQVCGKAGFDLNSGNFQNNICNGLEVVTDSVPVQTDKLSDVVCTENMPAVSDVGKFIKHEEVTTNIPSPVIPTISGQSVSSIAKSFLSKGNVASPAVRLCELVTQPTIYTSEPAGSNPVKSRTDCKPTASLHARENVTRKPCDTKEACDVSRSSSNPTADSFVFKSLLRPVLDGMSQGSASMDCSDDVDNAVSQLPTTNKPLAESSLVNNQISETNNLSAALQKEVHDVHHDGSSVTNKVRIQGLDDVKRANSKDVIGTHSGEEHESEVSVYGKYRVKQMLTSEKNLLMNNTDVAMQDVNIATSSADLRRSPSLGTSSFPKIYSTGPSHKKFDNTVEKSRMPVIKSERSQSPDGKQAANCSEGNGKIGAVESENGTEAEDIARASNLQPSDSVLGEEDSHLDGASTSQPHEGSTKLQSVGERSEYEKSKPDSSMTSSVQNEKDGQVNESHWRDVANAYVNRNERWERFMKSEREKKGEYHGGRQAYDMNNQRRMDHRYGGRGGRYHGHPRNFRGPRMNDDSDIDFPDEPITGRRRPFDNDFGHLHRNPHRRLRSPPNQMPGFLMRGMEHDPRLQMDDISDEMMEERFFVPHPHQHHALGDHEFIHRDRSHSPGQRRGAPTHFHRGRSSETMHRSPPLNKTDRPYLPHQRHMRRRVSPPFDRLGHDERGMQRNMRRCGMHQGGREGDNFEPPLHPAQLAELHAEAEHTERRKFGERRAYRRSLEESPSDDEEMLSYHGGGDMEFADGDGGPREPDGRFRNRPEHRPRGEQEDGGYKYRGPQGCRGGSNSSDGKSKKRRY